jgi:serine/threonine-protein kinase
MGEVWKAQDMRLSRVVAIKVLPPDIESDPGLKMRFERESKILAALNHPNIAQIYEAGEVVPQVPGQTDAAPIAFLVMELVDGRNLLQVLNEGRPSILATVRLGRQIAKALAAAHKAGIIHRDLKPANIMVNNQNAVKVLDFGLAKPIAKSLNDVAATFPEVTVSGMVLGTAAYMSPEQVRGEGVDTASDIWALGCVLYQMLTSMRPFRGESIPEIMASILRDPVDPIRLYNPDAPASLCELVEKCLSKDPFLRPPDASSIASSFRQIFHEIRQKQGAAVLPIDASGQPEVVPPPEPTHVLMINRYLKQMNNGFPEIPVTSSGPGWAEIEMQGIRIGMVLSHVILHSCDMISFVIPLFDLPVRPPSDFLKKLLLFSCWETDVAQFSIDADRETVNLTCVRPCANLDFRSFQYTIHSMTRISADLSTRLRNEFPSI